MDPKIQAVIQFGNEAVVRTLYSISSYDCLVKIVKSRWNMCSINNVSFFYSLPGYESCYLSNEDEFSSMCFMVEETRVMVVKILVRPFGFIGESSGKDICLSLSKGTSEVTSVYDGFCGVEKLSGKRILSRESSSSNEMSLDSYNMPIQDQSLYDVNSGLANHPLKQLLSRDWAFLIKEVGQQFEGGIVEFRRTLLKFCIMRGYNFRYKRNCSNRISAVCIHRESLGCEWQLVANLKANTNIVFIKMYNCNHTCGDAVEKFSDPRISSDLIASLICDHFKAAPGDGSIDILRHIKRLYGLDISYEVARNSVEKARDTVFGEMGRSYDLLPYYCEKMKLVDPTSTFNIERDSAGHFVRCFIAFGATFQGFEFCRPMLFLDGTHLTGKYKGQLLAATAKDGNNGLFHIAFAVVGSEDEANWTWFLEQLKPIIGGRVITFISDRCKGLINAVDEVFPYCFHSYCLNHVIQNLKDKFKGCKKKRERMVELLKEMSTASTEEEYKNKYMDAITKGGDTMIDFMLNLPVENFAKPYFKGTRYGEMTSNGAESFNAMIKKYKHLPVTEFVDQIRRHLMQQISARKHQASTWTHVLCPVPMTKYNFFVGSCRSWLVHTCSEDIYEVMGDSSFTVDIAKRTCTCSLWQHEGFPCAHAIAVLLKSGHTNPYSFIEKYFYSDSYRMCYSSFIHPVEHVHQSALGDNVDIIPPVYKRGPGRPKKKRMVKHGYIAKRKMKCSRCKQIGTHNRRTCKEPIIY